MFCHGFPFVGPYGWGWVFGILISIILISVFVRIIIRIIRGDNYRCHRHHRHWNDFAGPEDPSAAARRILDERYAKGEIDDEEYKRKRENLK